MIFEAANRITRTLGQYHVVLLSYRLDFTQGSRELESDTVSIYQTHQIYAPVPMFTGRYFLKYLLLLTMVRFAIPPRNGLRRVPHCRHPWFLGTLVKQEIMTDGHG